MSKTSGLVFWALYVVAWLIFIGVAIEAGGLVVNFFFSLYNPDLVQNLYQKLDLSELYQESKPAFFGAYACILTIWISKACLFYAVIRLMHQMNMKKPFIIPVDRKITVISYFTLFIGLLSYMARQLTNNLAHYGFAIDDINQFWADSQTYILMGALILFIAALYKKGVMMQKESDLTV